MTASTLIRTNVPSTDKSNNRSRARQHEIDVTPAQPDKQLWKTDEKRAFEAGVQWFLAVSRTA
jgi:hypothetical protein